MNLLPAAAGDGDGRPPRPNEAAPSNDIPVSLRTLPTILKAGDGGSLAQILVEQNEIPNDPAALEQTLLKYFQDPDLPFDQTLIKVDPNLRYSELMTVINAFSNAFEKAKKEPKLSVRGAASRRGRMSDRGITPSGRFFRGSELPRLLFLAAIMVAGWVAVWDYRPAAARSRPSRRQAVPKAGARRCRSRGRVRDGHRPHADVVPRQRRLCLLAGEGKEAHAGRAGPAKPARHRSDPSLGAARALPRSSRSPVRHGHADCSASSPS